MPQVEREIVINAPPEKVYEVITDYESYPQFLPEIVGVETLSRNDGEAVIRFELELIMRISYTLRLKENGKDGVHWTLEEAKLMDANTGSWELRSGGEPGTTHVRYGLEIKLRGLIPKSVSSKLTEITLPQTLQRFKERAESLM